MEVELVWEISVFGLSSTEHRYEGQLCFSIPRCGATFLLQSRLMLEMLHIQGTFWKTGLRIFQHVPWFKNFRIFDRLILPFASPRLSRQLSR
jgi:hypothetical protein